MMGAYLNNAPSFQHSRNDYDRGRSRFNDRDNRDRRNRSRSNSPHRNHYQRDRHDNSHRSRTRSPSPFEGCHSCGQEGHMAIECPHKTAEERELKLFYLVYARHLDRDKEDELRKKYNLVNLGQNRYTKALSTTMRMGQNSRSFCHWCNMKNDHNTIWCNQYCPLCKKDGHWWGKCTEHTDTVNKRMDNLSKEMEDKRLN